MRAYSPDTRSLYGFPRVTGQTFCVLWGPRSVHPEPGGVENPGGEMRPKGKCFHSGASSMEEPVRETSSGGATQRILGGYQPGKGPFAGQNSFCTATGEEIFRGKPPQGVLWEPPFCVCAVIAATTINEGTSSCM